MIAVHLRDHARSIAVGSKPLNEKFHQLNSLETALHWLERAGAISPAEKFDVSDHIHRLRGALHMANDPTPNTTNG